MGGRFLKLFFGEDEAKSMFEVNIIKFEFS